MRLLSATCLAVAVASKAGTLRLVERPSRLGGVYVAIEDDRGVIEVADDMSAALARVASVEARAA
jgi:hypothetical protein